MNARTRKIAKDLLKTTIGRLGDILCSPPTKLVIFSRGRTGSNLLVWLLKSHPKVRHHGEIVGESYLQHSFIRNEINRIGSVKYFERATRRMVTEQVIGVKFLYHQLESEYAGNWAVPDIVSLRPVLQERKDLCIIHLKRRNRLATLVSWKLARQTQEWAQLAPSQWPRSGRSGVSGYDGITIKLSYEECLEEFSRIEQWEQYYDRAFANHRFVEMYYEDLVADQDSEIVRALKLLEVESRRLQSPLRKQNTRPLNEIVENFAELKRNFAYTRYADFFDKVAP